MLRIKAGRPVDLVEVEVKVEVDLVVRFLLGLPVLDLPSGRRGRRLLLRRNCAITRCGGALAQ
eukprot:117951-Heterocapsa_arctica.AAC.1